MAKIALVQPNSDELYANPRQGYFTSNRPPETGLAILASYLKKLKPNSNVVCLNPDYGDDLIAKKAANYDFFGLTDWFSNHRRVIAVARMAKTINPKIKIIIGGPNVTGCGDLILQKYPFIDYAITRDGEEALWGLTQGLPELKIPNLWFRQNGRVSFSFAGFVNLELLPLWDFSSFEEFEKRIEEYGKVVEKKNFDPWLASPLTIFSFRGCAKAIRRGACSYCTSAETSGRSLSPGRFWEQLRLLKDKYNALSLYVADDVFSTTLDRMGKIAQAKPLDFGVTPKLRANAYMPDFTRLKRGKMDLMAEALSKIGVFNLFFGVENFGANQLAGANKEPTDLNENLGVINTLGDKGVKATIAYLIGLPGETEENLKLNLRSLETFLNNRYVERICLSVVIPLRGTEMFKKLCDIESVRKEYLVKTGRNLAGDDYPDYKLLQRLSLIYCSKVKPDRFNFWLEKMIGAVLSHLPAHQLGSMSLDEI